MKELNVTTYKNAVNAFAKLHNENIMILSFSRNRNTIGGLCNHFMLATKMGELEVIQSESGARGNTAWMKFNARRILVQAIKTHLSFLNYGQR